MNLLKGTRYALYASMEMARATGETPVTAAQVAERYGIPAAVLAKTFQQLVRAGLATGTRGARGGYALARPAGRINVLEVIEAFETPREPEQCLLAAPGEPDCERPDCRLRRLLDEVDEVARSTFASVTLDTLVGNRPRAGSTLSVIS